MISAASAGFAQHLYLGAAPSSSARVTGNAARLEEMDYRWTQELPTEIFFIVLTAVVFPYAAWRLLRRLRGSRRLAPRRKPDRRSPDQGTRFLHRIFT
jgi:hypothetical protein